MRLLVQSAAAESTKELSIYWTTSSQVIGTSLSSLPSLSALQSQPSSVCSQIKLFRRFIKPIHFLENEGLDGIQVAFPDD